MHTTKPWLLIDVDGPLNITAFGRRRTEAVTTGGYLPHVARLSTGEVYPLLLNPAHGRALTALTDVFELAWATSWGEHANEHIGPRLGLPTLPVVPLDVDARAATPRLSYKTDQIAVWAAGRPFAWVDDEVNRYDRFRLAGDARVSTFLALRVEEHLGLRDGDFDTLRRWAEDLESR